MDHETLGKILATVVTACIDATAIVTSSGGVLKDSNAVGSIIQGFLSIWLSHSASGNPTASTYPKG